MRVLRYIVAAHCFLFPALLHAQVIVSEIMYDLDGSDTDREWVEVQNTGGSDVDISTWKLRENETNHGLSVFQGNSILPPGGFAIIADTPNVFLGDYPGYSGVIFDSSFSLLNTGEVLTLRDADLADVDSVSYSSEQGGNGDGNSLQRVGGVWLSGTPTPGAQNSGSTQVASSNSESGIGGDAASQVSGTTDTSSGTKSNLSIEQTIFPDAGPDKTAIAGATTLFEGEALGIQKKPLATARYIWNFGDGETVEGKKVTHTYRYPGEFSVVLNVSSGDRSNTDRLMVRVVEIPLTISAFSPGPAGFVELSNTSDLELDISWWQIFDGTNAFVLPQNTIILPKAKLRLANEMTKMDGIRILKLLYPNGIEAMIYQESQSQFSAAKPSVALAKEVAVSARGVRSENAPAPGAPSTDVMSTAAALPLAFGDEREPSSLVWILGLVGLLGVSVAGVIFLRRLSRRSQIGFEIVE